MRATCVSLALLTASTAFAADGWKTLLQPRDLDGNGTVDAYYEPAQDMTWLRDANYYATLNPIPLSPSIPLGQVTGASANDTWAAQQNIYGTFGWRLPDAMASVACAEYMQQFVGAGSCTDSGDPAISEMAHLGLVTLENGPSFAGPANVGPFINYQPGNGPESGYWTDVLPTPGFLANYYIHADLTGGQYLGGEYFNAFVWFVHDGDIGTPVSAVPEPSTLALCALGLGVLAACRRRRPTPRCPEHSVAA